MQTDGGDPQAKGERDEARHPTAGTAPSPRPTRCWSCNAEIAATDEYCRRCGRKQIREGRWYHEPVLIIVLALTVLGPFALPLIWKSPRMSRGAKWTWTVLLTLLTVIALWLLWVVAAIMIERWREIGNLLQEIR